MSIEADLNIDRNEQVSSIRYKLACVQQRFKSVCASTAGLLKMKSGYNNSHWLKVHSRWMKN